MPKELLIFKLDAWRRSFRCSSLLKIFLLSKTAVCNEGATIIIAQHKFAAPS
jgi:hypothetical protein